jgi:hypothetical protein
MMRLDRIAVVAVLGLPVAGCLGVTLPPKELPAWAISPQSEAVVSARPTSTRSVATRRAPERTANVSYVAPKNAPPSEVTPFSAEWQAREDAFDNKVRRTMNICRGC